MILKSYFLPHFKNRFRTSWRGSDAQTARALRRKEGFFTSQLLYEIFQRRLCRCFREIHPKTLAYNLPLRISVLHARYGR